MTVLQDVKSALQEDAKAEVVRLIPRLIEENNQHRGIERGFLQLATTATRADDESAPATAGQEYIQRLSDIEPARTSVDTKLIEFLNGDATNSEVVEAVETAIDAKNALDEATQNLVTATGDLSLPPVLSFRGIADIEIPLGSELNRNAVLENLGGNAAEDIEFEVYGDLDIGFTPTAIPSLGPEDTHQVEVSVSPDSADTFSVEIVAESPQSVDSIEFNVAILRKQEYLERALQQTQDLQDTLSGFDVDLPAPDPQPDGGPPGQGGGPPGDAGPPGQGDDPDDGDGARRGLDAQLDAIADHIERLIDRVDEGRIPGHAIDNQIGAVINQYESFQNHVDGLENGDVLTAFQEALLTEDARRAVETLEQAQEAEA